MVPVLASCKLQHPDLCRWEQHLSFRWGIFCAVECAGVFARVFLGECRHGCLRRRAIRRQPDFSQIPNYGHTEQGTYMCEADAKAAGDRAAENEKHP
jgi:hypothetical protein